MRALLYLALYAFNSAAKPDTGTRARLLNTTTMLMLSSDGPGVTADSSSLYGDEDRMAFG